MVRRWSWSVGLALALVAVLASLAGCIRIEVVDASADGGLVRLRDGDLLTIRLRGNPSTGASWAFSWEPDPMVLELTEDVSFSADSEDVCGSPGTFTFRLRAVGTGTTQVALEYGRAWEEDVLDQFTVIVYVH
ncbi:protease inhibitor I42 family protein [Candidatus Bipolaricaulota bacterium]|nr:protease inhibitor I42 family protein [Candidatus Bipolaricaulota bacterium]